MRRSILQELSISPPLVRRMSRGIRSHAKANDQGDNVMSTPRALRPLRNAAYRWLAAALVASMIGTGIWMVALVWQIVAIGGGAAELSLVAGASAVGMLLTTLLGGALADRMSQRRILLVVEV